MDKPSEKKKDSKSYGDTDIGIQDYGAGGKREQLDGLWSPVTITGGSTMQRLGRNNYCKTDHDKSKGKSGSIVEAVLEEHDTHGPPIFDVSKPKRVF